MFFSRLDEALLYIKKILDVMTKMIFELIVYRQKQRNTLGQPFGM
jgi:hypothetical protein